MTKSDNQPKRLLQIWTLPTKTINDQNFPHSQRGDVIARALLPFARSNPLVIIWRLLRHQRPRAVARNDTREVNNLCSLTRAFAKKRQADFENLPSQPRTKPKPQNKANQNHRRPKREPKTLKPVLATRPNQPETLLTKENLLSEETRT
ncbi:MAG: hypothetical protein FD178_3761 [Ignavibacteria bacterium]|nr:MAG: hypothetical protein FD178_3761 [Ignavibacteria bacterium]